MTTWFTSDTHFGHENIIAFAERPFNDVNHMNISLVNNWNEVVSPDDTVYVVGDSVMGHVVESLKYVAMLNGTKILLPGNHDRCWRGGKKNFRDWISIYKEFGFDEILDEDFIVINLDGIEIQVCHFPRIMASRHKDRYDTWRPEDLGLWLIHGHIHSRGMTCIRPELKSIDVGVDAWDYYPVAASTIIDVIKEHDDN